MSVEDPTIGQEVVEVNSGQLLDQKTSAKLHELTPLVNRYLADQEGRSWETYEEAKVAINEIKEKVHHASHDLLFSGIRITLQPTSNGTSPPSIQRRPLNAEEGKVTSNRKLPLLTARSFLGTSSENPRTPMFAEDPAIDTALSPESIPKPDQDLLDLFIESADVQKILGVSRQRVQQLCAEGRIFSVKTLRTAKLFWKPDIQSFAQHSRPTGHQRKKVVTP